MANRISNNGGCGWLSGQAISSGSESALAWLIARADFL